MLVGSEDVDGVFTPGELLKIALAACSGMSSDMPLARRLGDDYKAVIRVSGAADREQERYPLLEETLELDLSGLAEDEGAPARRGQPGHRPGLHGRAHPAVRHRRQLRGERCRILTPGSPPGCTGTSRGGFPVVDAVPGAGLGLTGYAANQADGRVLVVAQGPREAGEKLLELLRGGASGPPSPDASTRSSPTGRSPRSVSRGSSSGDGACFSWLM